VSTPPPRIRVLLADDHEIVRSGLRAALEAEPDIRVVAEAADGFEAVQKAAAGGVDLAVLDIAMPRMTGLQAAAEMHRRRPALRVVMLSVHDDERYFFEALKAGASGYVLKSAANRDLVDACRASMHGETFLYPPAVAAIVRDYLDGIARGEDLPAELLSAREMEVVKLIAEGHSGDEIAAQLVLSTKTVERHRANILAKLELRNRVDLTRYAIRRGLVEP
jgi:DNA-binding NarL/FixJ family response regulator